MILRSAAFVSFGLCAFLIKSVLLVKYFLDPESWRVVAWLQIAAFLNQTMGIVLLDDVLHRRVMRFVFAGADATMEPREWALHYCYTARLAKAVWETYGGGWRAVVTLGTLNHVDLQKLLLEEDR